MKEHPRTFVTTIQKWETELKIKEPWRIDDILLKPIENTKNQEERHIFLSYKRGTHFTDETGIPCPVYNTYNKTWRHLDQDEHLCYVHCKVPRIETTEGKVKLINVPWARQASGFTLCFEARVINLFSKNQPVNSICTQLKEPPNRILVVFNHWMNTAYVSQQIDQNIDTIGIDEQSNNTNRHITILVDLNNKRVLSVVEGKNQDSLQQIKTYLENKGIDPIQIKHISGNLFNQTLLTQLKSCFPNATLYCDRLYILQHLNEAMDQVSSTERKNIKKLTKHRTLFRTDPSRLSAEQKTQLLQLIKDFPRIEKAYRLKISFNSLWEQKSAHEVEMFLESWCRSVEDTGLAPFKDFAETIKKHKNSIIDFTSMPTSTAVLKSTHEKIQQIKGLKSGLRNIENFSNMIYLLCGKLSFSAFSEYIGRTNTSFKNTDN